MSAANPVEPFARVGEVVAGKFRIERLLGEGGMGLVVEAMHLQLDERVALKFLRREVMLQADIVARFAQEARSAAKLKSEHVARVLDVGEHGGVPYIVMEYLKGQNLEELLAARGPLSMTDAVELVIQAAAGMSEAHARGIIHRDLKPANLFVAQNNDGWETLKILDFGISKAALTSNAQELSVGPGKTLSLLGSPYYMSPEQLRSTRDVDRRTDIWALGAVLFELLTGVTAFASTEFVPLVTEISNEPHRRLTTLRGDLPLELESVVDRALAKDPAQRFQSAGALALALLAFTTSKRSRVIASQAVTISRSSGIDPALPLPSTVPTASGSVRHIIVAPSSVPDLQLGPSSSGAMPISAARGPASGRRTPISAADPTLQHTPVSLPARDLPSSPGLPNDAARSRLPMLAGLLAVLLVVLGAIAVAFILRTPPVPAAVGTQVAPTPSSSGAGAAPTASATPSSSAAPSVASASASPAESASVPEKAAPAPSARPEAHPVAAPRPATTTPAVARPARPASPASPPDELDIHRSR